MDVDFDSARQRINERLNQELTRIRNLPKKSKIKICNKHGLQHAHHMNTGLLKSLEVDLAIIKREERRVNNELQKKRKNFTENTQRSFPRLLPIPGQENDDHGEKKREFPNQRSPQRFHASWTKPELPDYFSRLEHLENQQRKAFLMAITEQSKRATKQIIEENIKKMETPSRTNEPEDETLLTRLNKRLDLRKSCFPSLLGAEKFKSSLLGTIPEKKRPHPKANSYYKGTTFFMPETENGQSLTKESGEKTKKRLGNSKNNLDSQNLSQNRMKLQRLPKIEISEAEQSNKLLKKIIERKVVGPNQRHGVSGRLGQNDFKMNQTVLKVKKKLNSEIRLDGTMKMRKENSLFTEHWS